MAAVATRLSILLLSLVIVRIATTALMLTGMSRGRGRARAGHPATNGDFIGTPRAGRSCTPTRL